jgi:flagellar biosynthetic protein FliP
MVLIGLFLVALGSTELCAQTNTQYISSGNLAPFRINVGLESATQPQEVDSAIKILFAITLLTLAPSILLLMTCFTRS